VTMDQRQQLKELLSDALPDPAALKDAALDAEPDDERRKTLLQQISRMNCGQPASEGI